MKIYIKILVVFFKSFHTKSWEFLITFLRNIYIFFFFKNVISINKVINHWNEISGLYNYKSSFNISFLMNYWNYWIFNKYYNTLFNHKKQFKIILICCLPFSVLFDKALKIIHKLNMLKSFITSFSNVWLWLFFVFLTVLINWRRLIIYNSIRNKLSPVFFKIICFQSI